MWNNVVKDASAKMVKAIDYTKHELSSIHTGRANPALLDPVKVNYYGAPTNLKQLATVTAPEPRMMLVQPFDVTSVADIFKAIQAAGIGFTPQMEGKLIRIPIPSLSKERREELVKLVKKITEDGRVSVRNVRRDANDQIKKLEKEKDITEDDSKKALGEIQKATDSNIRNLDEAAVTKEKELLTV